MDGSDMVQRFLLPSLTKDVSFPLPPDPSGNPQQAVSLQAAPNSPHAVAVIAGNWSLSPPGDGVYVFDDVTQRPTSVKGYASGGPMIDWFQWGATNSVIYGNQYTTIDQGGVATIKVTSAGASLLSYNGGQVGPAMPQYDVANNLLYSNTDIFNPTNGSFVGTYNSPLFPLGEDACTADSSAGRYYCVVAYNSNPSFFELWVWDLNTAALINRVDFGATAGQSPPSVTGRPTHLVRWGNAGLALTTITAPGVGSGGVFLVDGPAVNPNSAPDYASGAGAPSYSWITSLVPQQAPTDSGDISITINGMNFAPSSTACWNCAYPPSNFLPTSYVSPTQLNVTMPSSLMATPGQLPIRVFDEGTNLFSTDTLTFTVSASTGSTQVTALNLTGLAMTLDSKSGLIYVGVANFDAAYQNSIVAVNGANGSITQSQTVTADPNSLSISADGQYLYAGFLTATVVTQLQLPGLSSQLTWTLSNPQSSAVYTAGDIRAAPTNPETTAVTLWNLASIPDELGGIVIYDGNVQRPTFIAGTPDGEPADTLAWGSSDQVLTGALAIGALDEFQINSSGATFVSSGPASFNVGEIHSDFGTGLIYSDDGNVADPTTQAVVGTYSASGLVAPDSSLNRVFILGQTQAQANTNNFTVQSFDENAYTPVSSITLTDLHGTPTELIRWGASGLAVLTIDFSFTTPGMLYLIQDTNFVSNAQSAASAAAKPRELVRCRWKRISKSDIRKMLRERAQLH